jgi:2-keto-4-pentenoate hydratase/2-oxohepta-3-ene-1,7-dioic acid hydratase in catechol pathway
MGKAIDTFAPCGPALVLLDEIPDLQALGLRARVNGQTLQDASASLMIFAVAEAIAHLTRVMTPGARRHHRELHARGRGDDARSAGVAAR